MHENLKRDEPGLGSSDRNFGFVFAAVFLLIGAAPLLLQGRIRWWALPVSALFAIVAATAPALLAPLNRLWARFGALLHRVVSPVVLGVMFFGVLTPMGAVMRALGKDLLRLRLDRSASTYWIERTPPGPPPESFVDQF
jgi:predicted membrane metal-binding protein